MCKLNLFKRTLLFIVVLLKGVDLFLLRNHPQTHYSHLNHPQKIIHSAIETSVKSSRKYFVHLSYDNDKAGLFH